MKNETHHLITDNSESECYLHATYLLCIFEESPPIVHPVMIKYMQNRSKRNSEEDSENAAKCCTNKGHNEYVE